MSERCSRRGIPANSRKSRSSHFTPSPHRRGPDSSRGSLEKPIRVMERFSSEPTLWGLSAGFGEDHQKAESDDVALFPSKTCLDLFSAPTSNLSQSPRKYEEYYKDAKVVVNVTVEGSPGPIRTMVKLGSSVDETIRLVMNKYSQEGRSPKLDCEAVSSYDLHESYFSLQCLDKSDLIGDVGSRSFYLRRSSSVYRNNSSLKGDRHGSCVTGSEICPVNSIPPSPRLGSFLLFPAFICQRVHKILRRTRKLWKIFGCLQC